MSGTSSRIGEGEKGQNRSGWGMKMPHPGQNDPKPIPYPAFAEFCKSYGSAAEILESLYGFGSYADLYDHIKVSPDSFDKFKTSIKFINELINLENCKKLSLVEIRRLIQELLVAKGIRQYQESEIGWFATQIEDALANGKPLPIRTRKEINDEFNKKRGKRA